MISSDLTATTAAIVGKKELLLLATTIWIAGCVVAMVCWIARSRLWRGLFRNRTAMTTAEFIASSQYAETLTPEAVEIVRKVYALLHGLREDLLYPGDRWSREFAESSSFDEDVADANELISKEIEARGWPRLECVRCDSVEEHALVVSQHLHKWQTPDGSRQAPRAGR